MQASPPPPEEGQEWELRHDDGFVYKILHRLGGPTAASDTKAVAVLKAQEHRRRERKKRALLNLKAKYQSEISLDVMEWRPEEAPLLEDPGPSGDNAEEGTGSEIDKHLAKVEVQEAMIRRVSNLFDISEAICNAQEERLVQSFMDLPILSSSPRELMASLCNE